jgi:hypothetical protein
MSAPTPPAAAGRSYISYSATPLAVKREIRQLVAAIDPAAWGALSDEAYAAVEALCAEVLGIKSRGYAHAADADRRAAEATRRAGDCTEHAAALAELSAQVDRLGRAAMLVDEQRRTWIDEMYRAAEAHPGIKPFVERASRRQAAIQKRATT